MRYCYQQKDFLEDFLDNNKINLVNEVLNIISKDSNLLQAILNELSEKKQILLKEILEDTNEPNTN